MSTWANPIYTNLKFMNRILFTVFCMFYSESTNKMWFECMRIDGWEMRGKRERIHCTGNENSAQYTFSGHVFFCMYRTKWTEWKTVAQVPVREKEKIAYWTMWSSINVGYIKHGTIFLKTAGHFQYFLCLLQCLYKYCKLYVLIQYTFEVCLHTHNMNFAVLERDQNQKHVRSSAEVNAGKTEWSKKDITINSISVYCLILDIVLKMRNIFFKHKNGTHSHFQSGCFSFLHWIIYKCSHFIHGGRMILLALNLWKWKIFFVIKTHSFSF